ncbi:MAG: hypothetical protein WCK89_23110 [bacterium]
MKTKTNESTEKTDTTHSNLKGRVWGDLTGPAMPSRGDRYLRAEFATSFHQIDLTFYAVPPNGLPELELRITDLAHHVYAQRLTIGDWYRLLDTIIEKDPEGCEITGTPGGSVMTDDDHAAWVAEAPRRTASLTSR